MASVLGKECPLTKLMVACSYAETELSKCWQREHTYTCYSEKAQIAQYLDMVGQSYVKNKVFKLSTWAEVLNNKP